MTTPYYSEDAVTLYHGDCLEIDAWLAADVMVTDPPYPNNAGHFVADIPTAVSVAADWDGEALIFWNELAAPLARHPLVAVHIWHRPNVNGRPYEPVFHFAPDGRKRRSNVYAHSFIHGGVGPGSFEYVGHPTQKPEALMRQLLRLTSPGAVADPFAGSGSTLLAAKSLGRQSIGVERNERYCEAIAKRLAQDVLDFDGGAA